MAEIERVGNVFYRAQDLDAAVDFYQQTLGLRLKFRDGDRWAAFDVAGLTLALEGADETVEGRGGAVVSLRVRGLDELVGSLRERGAQVGAVETGPHELRADLFDPSGNRLVLYEPLPRG